MRLAPPAQAWCRSGGAWWRLQQLICASSVGVAATWVAAHLGLEAAAALGWGVGLGAALLAGREPAGAPQQLAWDGGRWSLQVGNGGPPQPGRALPMLDLGEWMLVRFDHADRGRRWLALSRRDAPAGWPALRAALYAR
jgi:hypothetical protein